MPKTLLVVDASRTIREAARLALAGEDWEVVEATNAAEALREAQTLGPDAVLCEVALPDSDGYELCRTLRRLPNGGNFPILLMGAAVDGPAATAAGASQTLSKPFAADELADALLTALEFQSFSGSFSATPAAREDAPLSVEDLAGPFGLAPQAAPTPQGETLEIIDLSGEEEYEDLELLEDLEPVALAPVEEQAKPWETQPWEPPAAAAEASAPGSLELDFGDVLAEAEEPGLDLEEPARQTEAGPLQEAEETVFTWDDGGPDRADEASEPPAEPEEPLAEPAPPEGLPAGEPIGGPRPEAEQDVFFFEPPALEPGLTSPSVPAPPEPTEESIAAGPLEGPCVGPPVDASAIASAAEEAVREALERSLSPEAVLPVVEAVVERVVWEVVPRLAERLILEAIEKLKAPPPE